LNFAETAVRYLADQGYDSKMGARPLSRKIDEIIRVPLSKKILFDRLRDCVIDITVRDGVVDFAIRNNEDDATAMTPKIDEKGYIILDQFKPRQ
jgi:ATP-dependent Clp protease ATP-binding subunit ClpA